MDQQEFQSQVLTFIQSASQKFEHFDERLTHVDERLDVVHEDLRDLKQDSHRVHQRLDRLEDGMLELNRKVEDIHQSRSFVKIKFGWEWSAVSFAIAFLASGVASGMTKFVWR